VKSEIFITNNTQVVVRLVATMMRTIFRVKTEVALSSKISVFYLIITGYQNQADHDLNDSKYFKF